jgi:hypothetical protein
MTENDRTASTAAALVIRNDAKVCNPYPLVKGFVWPSLRMALSMHIIMKYSTSTVVMLCQSSMTVNKRQKDTEVQARENTVLYQTLLKT